MSDVNTIDTNTYDFHLDFSLAAEWLFYIIHSDAYAPICKVRRSPSHCLLSITIFINWNKYFIVKNNSFYWSYWIYRLTYLVRLTYCWIRCC